MRACGDSASVSPAYQLSLCECYLDDDHCQKSEIYNTLAPSDEMERTMEIGSMTMAAYRFLTFRLERGDCPC
jgi:hypothetical protein